MISIIVVLLSMLAPPFSARWDAPGVATFRWSQVERGCLYRESAIGEHVFAGCYEGTGAVSVTFGRVGPLSGDLRPTAGDVWVLDSDGVTTRAPLRSVGYLAVWRG